MRLRLPHRTALPDTHPVFLPAAKAIQQDHDTGTMTSGHLLAAPPGAPRDATLRDSYAPICRNVRIAGRRTSVRMERVMWVSLYEICKREGMSVNEICTLIDRRRSEGGMTAALRVFIISYFRELMRLDRTLNRRPPPHGHRPAGDRTLLAALTVFGPRSA